MEEKKRILIVEDDDVLRDVLTEKLSKNGYSVDVAQDGIIALEKLHAVKPDLILLDILMPRKNGIEVLEELHVDQNLKDVPVIIISNSGQPLEIARAQELGAREFIAKAVFDPNEVLEKVKHVLAGGTISVAEWGQQTKDNTITPATDPTLSTPASSANPVPVVAPEPVITPVSTPVAVPIPAAAPAGDTPAKKLIMVVEDDKFLRELLVRKLMTEGFAVESAIEATAAFTILAQFVPNIILLDLILPGVDGFEILTRIKADPRLVNVPVIILSNLGQKEDLDRAMTLGAKDFMVKANFTLDEIVAKVRGIIG